jgi:hypothetical protein
MASGINQPILGGGPRGSLCADDLFVGELLQSVVEYISRCPANFDRKGGEMVELAREQNPQIRQMIESIDREIEQLEVRMNKKSAARAPRLNGTSKRITETGKRDSNRRE